MDTCPTCNNEMVEVSELIGVSVYDLLYWCQRCGTLVYRNDGVSIFLATLGQKHRSSRMVNTGPATDELGESWLKVEIPANVDGFIRI